METTQQIYHGVGTVQKPNRKIVDRGKIDTPYTQIHNCSLYWLGTGTSEKVTGLKEKKNVARNEMMRRRWY